MHSPRPALPGAKREVNGCPGVDGGGADQRDVGCLLLDEKRKFGAAKYHSLGPSVNGRLERERGRGLQGSNL